MEHKVLFRPFRRRLLIQALLRATLSGLTTGAAAIFLTSLIFHILIRPTQPILFALIFSGAFLAGFLPVLICRYPTDKRVADRLDKAGLQERAGTMLALRKDNTILAQLQRKDAAAHIRQLSPKKLTTPFPVKLLCCCALALTLCGTACAVPYDILAPEPPEAPPVDPYVQQVTDLIEDLRQQVRDAELARELEEELLALLDQLEKDLLAAQSQLDQAALIEQFKEAMTATVDMDLTRFPLGKALMEFDLTEPLGRQISGDDPLLISEPMNIMEAHVTENTRHLTRLSSNITSALENSGVNSDDLLYTALMEFSTDLDLLFRAMHTESIDDNIAFGGDISTVFDLAEESILFALSEQAHLEAEAEEAMEPIFLELDELLGKKIDSLKPLDSPDAGGAGAQGGNGGQNGSDSDYSGTIIGGMGDGTSNSTRNTMLEGIFDPISGNVSYGEVFAAYYAEYLTALEEGRIPEDLRPYFERYFSALS